MNHRKSPLAPRPALPLAFVAAAAQASRAHDLCNPKRPHRVKMRAFFMRCHGHPEPFPSAECGPD
jgi:hypothetical protein